MVWARGVPVLFANAFACSMGVASVGCKDSNQTPPSSQDCPAGFVVVADAGCETEPPWGNYALRLSLGLSDSILLTTTDVDASVAEFQFQFQTRHKDVNRTHCALFACAPRVRVTLQPPQVTISNYDTCVVGETTAVGGTGSFALSALDSAERRADFLDAGGLVTGLAVGCWAYDSVAMVAATDVLYPVSPRDYRKSSELGLALCAIPVSPSDGGTSPLGEAGVPQTEECDLLAKQVVSCFSSGSNPPHFGVSIGSHSNCKTICSERSACADNQICEPLDASVGKFALHNCVAAAPMPPPPPCDDAGIDASVLSPDAGRKCGP